MLQSWKSWVTSDMLEKLQSTLYQNYWGVLASKGRNDYDRRSSPYSPTVFQLQEHLRIVRYDPLWTEAMKIRQNSNFHK